MRAIEQTSLFRRGYKREAKSRRRQTLQGDFVPIVTALANDQPLAEKHRDYLFEQAGLSENEQGFDVP
jgi:mRNA interferase YafQ